VRVFVVGTGRCGTRTFAMACKHISNFTAGHETHARQSIGDLSYPDQHIEVDHHLTWGLPLLLKRYPVGSDAVYVHLLRDRAACVGSYSRRLNMDLFAKLACFVNCTRHTPGLRRAAAEYYYDAINALADSALRKAPLREGYRFEGNRLTVFIESLPEAWPRFWELIGAEGNHEAALAETRKRYNRGLESKGELVRDEH